MATLAVISDVHANLHALEAVLADIDEEGIGEIVCLGDTVGYAAHPARCLEVVRDRAELVLLGNHDHAVAAGESFAFNPHARAGVDYSRDQLDREAIEYLKTLEPLVRRADICYTHGSPRDPIREYVFPDTPEDDLADIAKQARCAFLLMGHTHVPLDLEVDGVRLLNPGSVGQPRDGDTRASYAVLDPDTGAWTLRRVEYDVEAAVEDVHDAGLPEFNGERLKAGM